MIPSDHFVRFYNEVFKALAERGHDHMEAYWRELGRLQTIELADRFRNGGLAACRDYWARIVQEENCLADLVLTEDYFELRMRQCPSLSKALDNNVPRGTDRWSLMIRFAWPCSVAAPATAIPIRGVPSSMATTAM